jgi:RNA polymerase sigma-70 factor (ECF subfamily)
MPVKKEGSATSSGRTLLDAFLSRCAPSVRASADAASIEAALARAIATAKREWPDLVDEVAFAVRLGECLSEADGLPEALEQLHVGDLALALACARGNAAAIVAFERLYFGDLERAWGKRAIDGKDLDDTKQILRARLFVEGDAPPKVLGYSGRGTLRGWMRAVITHQLMNSWRRGAREVPADDALFAALPSDADDAETARMKSLYKGALREAFLVALSGLAPTERNLLRYRFAESLSIQQIAVIYGIHRETAGIKLAQARASLEAGIRAELARRLRVSDVELASVVRVALSQIDVTLARVM